MTSAHLKYFVPKGFGLGHLFGLALTGARPEACTLIAKAGVVSLYVSLDCTFFKFNEQTPSCSPATLPGGHRKSTFGDEGNMLVTSKEGWLSAAGVEQCGATWLECQRSILSSRNRIPCEEHCSCLFLPGNIWEVAIFNTTFWNGPTKTSNKKTFSNCQMDQNWHETSRRTRYRPRIGRQIVGAPQRQACFS